MKIIKNGIKTILILLTIITVISFSINEKVYVHSQESTPMDEAKKLNTKSLINKIITDEIYYIYLFSDVKIGISKFKINNEYYLELSQKDDYNNVLNDMLENENISIEKRQKLNLLRNMLNNIESNSELESNQTLTKNSSRIYTPNGSIVEYAQYQKNDLTADDIESCHTSVLKKYPTLTEADYISPASSAYNCHSYAWYQQDVKLNNFWIELPTSYIDDFSYVEVDTVRPGDILCYWAYRIELVGCSPRKNYFISHSAIVLSGSLDLNDNSTLPNINLISKWGKLGLYTHNGDECPYGTRDSSFVYVKAYRPRTSNEYTLSNYNRDINNSLIIDSNTEDKDSYEMYCLVVNYTKYYEFLIETSDDLDIRLYDEHMQLVDFQYLENQQGYAHIIKQLTKNKTYYFRVAYSNKNSNGTINIKIVSRNTTYLGIGKNDLLINTYNNINEYVYVNNQGEGFYKFYFNTNINMSYAEGTLKIYSDENRTSLLNKYGSTEIEEAAMTYNGEKELYVYLPANGRYYLGINLLNKNYLSANITVEKIEKEKINYQDRITSTSLDELFTNKTETDYFKEIVISHSSKMELDIMTNGTINGNIPVYIFKKYCDDEHGNNYYSINLELHDYITSTEKYPVFTVILSAGTYYIGYSDNTNNVSIQFMLSRKVSENLNIDSTLVTDPARDQGFHLGSEVTLNNGVLLGDTITEGFTRNIYLMVEDRLREPMPRLEYDWYSSDESIAKVTAYGTVLAMQVDRDKEVTIYAVLKVDPSIVYRKTFTILNDTSNEEIVITCDMSFSYSLENGKYKLELNDYNSPYPMIQYYDWSVFIPCQENDINVSMNYWGIITATEPGTAIITGVY